MRKHYPPEFKMKLALEAIKGDKTLSQIASDHSINSARICEWRRQLLEKGYLLFDTEQPLKDQSFAEKEAELYQQIGELTCEVNYLKKKLGRYPVKKEEE